MSPSPVPNGLLDVDDVTGQAMHLVSDAGRFVAGTTFVCDAGSPRADRDITTRTDSR